MNIHNDLNELSAFNWFRCIKTQDLSYLLIDRSIEADNEELQKVFKALNDQLIDELGISDDYLDYLHKLRALNIAKATWLISQNNYDFTMYEVARLSFEQLEKKSNVKSNQYADKIKAERILGFRIDLKECSVIEYYNYLNEANAVAKQMHSKN